MQAQELIDHFIMKIRMVRFLRTPEFDSLFSGDPIWATEVLGGMGLDGRTLVSKTTFRYLHTLHTMGLQRRGGDRDPGGIFFKRRRQRLRPEHGQVRLRRRAHG